MDPKTASHSGSPHRRLETVPDCDDDSVKVYCAECQHWAYREQFGKWVNLCVKSRYIPDHVTHVHRPSEAMRECISVNTHGECDMYEPKPRLRPRWPFRQHPAIAFLQVVFLLAAVLWTIAAAIRATT